MFFFLLAFLSGILVKLADYFEDVRRSPIAVVAAVLYGPLIGYLISRAPFSMLFLGALFAQALAGKIDRPAHALGLALAFLVSLAAGFPASDPVLFFVFLVLAYMDELVLAAPWDILADYRIFLKLGGLAVSGLLLRWEYFIGILAFDTGYVLVHYFLRFREKKFLNQKRP